MLNPGILVPPLIVAHRGASRAEKPGNTVAAFERARELGADWVELDVRFTADQARAVHHDAELPDGRPICELPADELPAFVPLLEVALAACAGMGVNVEIKNAPDDVDFDPARSLSDAVVSELDGFARGRLLVTSFDLATVDRVRALDPSIATGLLAFELADPVPAIELAASHGHRAINPWDGYVDDRFMELARDAGLEVNVWTVNDAARMSELIELGVDAIITDVPNVLREVLSSESR
jgi:glycerophosphoryl diester phosphodiesterase